MTEMKTSGVTTPIGSEDDTRVEKSYADQISLYDLAPESVTAGTSYDFFKKYPDLPEEMYYLFECITLKNAEESEVVTKCREIIQTRNEEIIQNFGAREAKSELLDIEELDYGTDANILG